MAEKSCLETIRHSYETTAKTEIGGPELEPQPSPPPPPERVRAEEQRPNEDARAEEQRELAENNRRYCIIGAILVIFMIAIVLLIITMGVLSAALTPSSPNITSSLTVNLVANRPVPMMLNVFSSADYKSCIVTSNIKSFKDKNTQITGMLWIIPTLPQLHKKLYTDSFMLGPYNNSNELYIGPSSNLTVTFFSLSGVGTVTVQFINSILMLMEVS